MTPLASNPAVTDPKTVLTSAQQAALLAVRHYRFNRRARGGWQVGNTAIAAATIKALINHGLMIERGSNSLILTTAGDLAADKLKG